MSKSNIPPRNTNTLDAQVGQAWALHYKKQYDQALADFERLAGQDPTHIDANYGLGLTLAKLGHKDQARATFQKVMGLVAAKIEQQSPDDEDSRYSMLSRMVAQRLAQLDN